MQSAVTGTGTMNGYVPGSTQGNMPMGQPGVPAQMQDVLAASQPGMIPTQNQLADLP